MDAIILICARDDQVHQPITTQKRNEAQRRGETYSPGPTSLNVRVGTGLHPL